MPNWKTYDSMVRLVSAIVAAHPDLKLNYAEMAKYHGGGCNYKNIYDQMSPYKSNGEALRKAHDAGIELMTVKLKDTASGISKGRAKNATARAFGGGCTKYAIDFQLRKFKTDAALINKALADGIDPITVMVGENGGCVARDIARNFGGDCTKWGIDTQFRKFKADAVLITRAVERGEDPITVQVGGNGRSAKATASIMGSDVTANGLRFQISDRIRPIAKELLALQASGGDGKDIDLSNDKGSKTGELAACMGSDVTVKGVAFQFSDKFKHIASRQKDLRSRGEDPKDVDLSTGRSLFNTGTSKDEISKHFGSDSTSGGIGFQFRSIKIDAKRQRACVASGGDPLSLGIGTGSGSDAIAHFYPEATVSALDHRFRPIKADAAKLVKEMGHPPSGNAPRGSKTIAGKFGEDVTPKAVKCALERTRKEPHANLDNSMADNDGASAGTKSGNGGGNTRKRAPAAKKARAPAKGTQVKKQLNDDADDDEEQINNGGSDDEFPATPSKKTKTILNKVQSGRVNKSPRKAAPAIGTFADLDKSEGEDEYDQPVYSSPIKHENDENGNGFTSPSANRNGGGYNSYAVNGYSNGYSNGHGYDDLNNNGIYDDETEDQNGV